MEVSIYYCSCYRKQFVLQKSGFILFSVFIKDIDFIGEVLGFKSKFPDV